MRIVAGTARGCRLRAPRGLITRPTSDKVRGAVFNLLGQFFEGGVVLDLYAGSGALALEALSRGFERAVCVEREREAVVTIRRNAEACRLADRVEIVREKVEVALPRLPPAAFALALVDPPYQVGPEGALARLAPLLAPGALAVAEHAVRRPPADAYGALALAFRRGYGDTGVSIYHL
ncbi:MAG TPA: RsmD family RNA methyltransferase [Anaeromyxobacteraceae bacterium]|nr:RsmD family RNA methyltransferase [Anaeromyxobacteraceae bacterium]